MPRHYTIELPKGSGGEHDERLFEEREAHYCGVCGGEFILSDLKQSSGHNGMLCHDCWTAEEQLFDSEDF